MAFPQPGGDRSRTLAPILGALAIAVVVLIAVFTVGVHDSGGPNAAASPSVSTDKALACPSAYQQQADAGTGWVPSRPFGINGDDALVPHEVPTHAVVCAYLDGATRGGTKAIALSGRRVLAGSLTGLARTLSDAPRGKGGVRTCTAPATAAPDYLVGLSYGDAAVWVSAPGSPCTASTNGSFTTSENYAASAAASYAARRWSAR